MLRKSILSVLGGVVFAAILSLSATASASCFGFCLERVGNYYFAGCQITWFPDGDYFGPGFQVTCFYTEGGDPGGDPNIAD